MTVAFSRLQLSSNQELEPAVAARYAIQILASGAGHAPRTGLTLDLSLKPKAHLPDPSSFRRPK